MNVFLFTDNPSPALQRISRELAHYLPRGFCPVDRMEQADLVVLQVIGRNNHVYKLVSDLLAQGKHYAVIQVALRSTRNPNTADWLAVWQKASVVWSYYDLPALISEDGHGETGFNFYHAPLGADSQTFYLKNTTRPYMIEVNGTALKAEGIYECIAAADATGQKIAHFGTSLDLIHPVIDYFGRVSDAELNRLHNLCQYVSGLRRKDGFELAAVEGLLCGARPVLFDTPNYRQWFDGLAEFIPEAPASEVVANLIQLFQSERRAVTPTEIEQVKARFDWASIIRGFWERV